MLTLLELSSSLECTTKPSNFPLRGEKVVFLASWGELVISRKGVPTEMLPPGPGVLIHNWRMDKGHEDSPRAVEQLSVNTSFTFSLRTLLS